ncbi:MAG TPA: MFS transporter [Solirubrobacteraceae bacterium]|nr:MFS transporter [Solirubrobacteraceae bacterium]
MFLLACVLGLDTADVGSVGAIAAKLEHALSISNTQLGLLAAAPSICAAVITLPMGILTDRTNRVRLLWITMLAWSAAQAFSGFSQSFEMLLLIRIGLGAATAAATPAVASLVGDLFPGGERGRIWGLILSGEVVGSAFGYLIAGEAATLGSGSWRYAFYALAIPSFLAALAVRRWLPEPARGGRSCLRRGASAFISAGEESTGPQPQADDDQFEETKAQEKVEEHGVAPLPSLVLHADPESMSLWRAAIYILRIRTNLVLIIASALGYFYFTGVTTFGLVFFEGRYHITQGPATLLLMLLGAGGLVGVIAGGRLADRWLEDGKVNSRIIVGAVAFALAALFFLPGLLAGTLALSLPLFILAGAAFGARNPPLDAARLDIMHHRLWGRAEAVRTLGRRITTAASPIVFGLIADQFGGPGGHATPSAAHGFGATANAHGLRVAFLILLINLALGGILTFLATRTYPRDVATARASETETAADPHATPLRPAA